MNADRQDWVDYGRGICILGVVTLYAAQKMSLELGVSGWMQVWVDFAEPFRMPAFFMLTGLFLPRTIGRPWRSYIDSKVGHYLYFFLLWTLIYFASKLVVGRAGDGPAEWAADLAEMTFNGFAMLWFIAILPIFFVFTRLTRAVPAWLMLPGAVLLHEFPIYSDHWLLVGHFCGKYVFFYIGYRFAPVILGWAGWVASHRRQALLAVLVWAAVNPFLVSTGLPRGTGLSLTAALLGSGAIVAVGVLLGRFAWMEWLRYLGRNSIVIYLAFFLPMGALIVLAQRTGLSIDPGSMAALLSLVSVLFALGLYWATRHTPARLLFERPAWARLQGGVAANPPRERGEAMPANRR